MKRVNRVVEDDILIVVVRVSRHYAEYGMVPDGMR